jgi:hypothetical protein
MEHALADQAVYLLELLGTGVRPFDATIPAPVEQTGSDFNALLERARSGNPETGIPVKLTVGLEQVLSPEQQNALANALDRIAVVGANSALINLDGRILRVDVRTRTVVEEIEQEDTSPVTLIDAFIQAERKTDLDDETPAAVVEQAQINSARGVRNPSLVRALEGDATV